jgi:hypothetical protein
VAAEIFGVDGLIILFLLLVPLSLGLALWALIDAATRPDDAFKRAGQNKVVWIILPIVGLVLLGFVGGIIGIVYLAAIRPKVREQQALPGQHYATPPPYPAPSPPAPPQGWWLASDGRWYPPESAG